MVTPSICVQPRRKSLPVPPPTFTVKAEPVAWHPYSFESTRPVGRWYMTVSIKGNGAFSIYLDTAYPEPPTAAEVLAALLDDQTVDCDPSRLPPVNDRQLTMSIIRHRAAFPVTAAAPVRTPTNTLPAFLQGI